MWDTLYMVILKMVWSKSIALLHRLTQDVQVANLRSTAGDLTWVSVLKVVYFVVLIFSISNFFTNKNSQGRKLSAKKKIPSSGNSGLALLC